MEGLVQIMCLFVSASFSGEPSDSFLGKLLCDLIIWGEFPPEHDFLTTRWSGFIVLHFLSTSISNALNFKSQAHHVFFSKIIIVQVATSCINVLVWLLIVGAFWWTQNMTSIKEILCFIPKIQMKKPSNFQNSLDFSLSKDIFPS